MSPGPGTDQASLSSSLGEAPHPSVYRVPFNHLNIWAYLALAFVILAMAAVLSYMLYSCYHTAGLRVKLKTGTSMGVGASTGGVKGGWQNLEDPSEETVVERGEGSRSTKDQDVVDVNFRDEHETNGLIHPWNERGGSGLKGLGIQLERSSKLQYEFPNESQASMIHGSPHSTYSIGSTSDLEHEQDLESSDGSDCPSISAKPLAHTIERSATHLPFNIPLPLPLPLPLPVTPSPPTQKQVKQKRTRLRALTQILAHNLMQNQNGREFFELQPMIPPAENGGDGQPKGLSSETSDDSSPPSPPLSSSQFAFFAPYPNCNSTSSNSTSNSTSNATFASSGSPIATSTPITPLTPITPITPVTPTKPGFDSHNIQFIEAPARNSNASSGAGASSPEVQSALAAASMNSMTRAEMLWNDPKLSPVQGAPLDGEKTSLAPEVNGLVIAKTRAAGANLPGHVFAPLTTPDHVHRGRANLRLGYIRRGVSLSSPPSPSPSSHYSDSSGLSSPSITTARFILDRAELKRDNLRNRDRVGLSKEKEENMKVLSPIPRPVFSLHPQPSKSAEV